MARLIDLGAAAICAVTKPKPKPEACHTLSMTLAYAAIKAWDAERIRGEEAPSGYKNAELKGGFIAEFDADNNSLMFSLDPKIKPEN